MTREDLNKIDELAAHFFERSADIQAVSCAIGLIIEARLNRVHASAALKNFEATREADAVNGRRY